MTRAAETALIAAASVLAALGVAIVEFTRGNWLDAQVAITGLSSVPKGWPNIFVKARTSGSQSGTGNWINTSSVVPVVILHNGVVKIVLPNSPDGQYLPP